MKIFKCLLLFIVFSPNIFAGIVASKENNSEPTMELFEKMEANTLTEEKLIELVNLGAAIDTDKFLEAFKKAAWRGFYTVIFSILNYYSNNFKQIPLQFLCDLSDNLEILIQHTDSSELKKSRESVLIILNKQIQYIRHGNRAQQLGLMSAFSQGR